VLGLYQANWQSWTV